MDRGESGGEIDGNVDENLVTMRNNYRYMVLEEMQYATRSANAFQKIRLVVENLHGRLIVPEGHGDWVHKDFQSAIDFVRVPRFLTSRRLRKIAHPVVAVLIYLQKRRERFCWILPVSNETSIFSSLLLGCFGASLWLTTWDPPGVGVRDRQDRLSRMRCKMMDWLLCVSLRKAKGLILNLHPGFCEGKISKQLMPKVHTFINGTCVAHCKEIARLACKVQGRVGINAQVEIGKGCNELRDVIIGVCRKNENVSVVWIGGGSQFNRILSEIRSAGLGEDRVTMTGPTKHDEALKYLATSSLGLNFYRDVPSLRWNYVLKAPEFLSLGVPLVTTRSPGVEVYITDGLNGVVTKSRDVSDVSEAILSTIATPDKILRMAESASCSAEQFSWDAINKQIASAIYQGAI